MILPNSATYNLRISWKVGVFKCRRLAAPAGCLFPPVVREVGGRPLRHPAASCWLIRRVAMGAHPARRCV